MKFDDQSVDKQSLFPQSLDQIDDWAKRFGFLNSYNTLWESSKTHIGKYQRWLIEFLRNAQSFTEDQLLFMKKVEAAVNIINTLDIHSDLKKVVINEVVVNDVPWLLDSPLSNIPKQIKIEEIVKDEFIRILEIDYMDENVTVWWVYPYYKKNDPKLVYDYCLTLADFDEIDKKIIALALDKKPYYRNQALWGKEIESIDKVYLDREQWTIWFKWDWFDEWFNRFHFLLSICGWDEYWEHCYKKSIEEKKEYVRNSDRFKSFTPDFESGK